VAVNVPHVRRTLFAQSSSGVLHMLILDRYNSSIIIISIIGMLRGDIIVGLLRGDIFHVPQSAAATHHLGEVSDLHSLISQRCVRAYML
jgi:hypothetical protein